MVIFNKHLRCFLSVIILCSGFIPHIAASEVGFSAAPATAQLATAQVTSSIFSRMTPRLMSFSSVMAAAVVGFVVNRIAEAQSDFFYKIQSGLQSGLIDFAVAKIGGPVKKMAKAIPACVQRAGAFLCRKYYRMSENHQQLFAALPFVCSSSLCAGLGTLCAVNSELSPVLRYSLTGAFALSSLVSMYQAITAYRATHPVHADIQEAPATTVQSQLFDKIVRSLNVPGDQVALALEAHNSLVVTCSTEDVRESFMRYLASQTQANLFIIDANELVATPALLKTAVSRATLSIKDGIHKGAIFYIKHFDVLNTRENSELAEQLSEMIRIETNVAWSRLETIARIRTWRRYIHGDTPEATELMRAADAQAEPMPEPSILFIASTDNTGVIRDIFRSHTQFATVLEIANQVAGTITCQQTGQALTFDSWNNYIELLNSVHRSYTYPENFDMLRAERERVHAQQLRIASSMSTLSTIAGGYPAEIDVIEHTIAACKESHQPPTIKGVLLYGPPGCGKTYLARALAGTLRAPFFTAQVADILSAGADASRKLTALFAQAQAAAMQQDSGGVSILFIDECDQLLQPTSSAPDYIAPIAYTLRSLLSGFDRDYDRIVLIVATNKSPAELDQALTRSRRFDYKIHITYPTQAARAAIIAYHAEQKGLQLDHGFIKYLADNTPNCAASDLAMLVDKSMATASEREIDIQEALMQELVKMRGIQRKMLPPIEIGHNKEQYDIVRVPVEAAQSHDLD